MEESFDYNQVPGQFVHCFSGDCPRAGECLRQLAGRHVQPSKRVLRAVNPAMCPDEGGDFPMFLPMRTIRQAWGVRRAIERMPYKEGRAVVRGLNRMFKKATLNRISTCQRPLSPAEQRAIERLFVAHGVPEGEVFDRVESVYDWWGESL